jgi:hypothetical protein
VFEQPEFLQWAAENIVFLVGYEGKNHKISWGSHGDAKDEKGDKDEKDGDGKDEKDGDGKDEKDGKAEEPAKPKAHKEGECKLYPGITCEEHEKIAKDAKEGEGGPKLEFKGWPSSFMIAPDGTVEKHTSDRAVKDLIAGVEDFAKKSKVKPSKKYQSYLTALDDGDKAALAGKWKAAIAAYLKVDAVAKKMPSLAAKLPARVETLNTKVAEAFAKSRDDEATDLVAKIKAIKALRSEVTTKLSSGALPVLADLDAWIKENPVPPAAPPAK